MAPPATLGDRSGSCAVKTNQYPYKLAWPVWSTANNEASLTARTRPDQLTEPQTNTTTGEYVIDPDPGSYMLVKPLISTTGHVLTYNIWAWFQGTTRADPTTNPPVAATDAAAEIIQWHPELIGRWTCAFNGGAVADKVGVANGIVLNTHIYCSLQTVVATYDRSASYTNLWKVIQPAADDGSPSILLFDMMGAVKISFEGRTTTNGDSFNFWHRTLSGC